jgi:hypothetical protein
MVTVFKMSFYGGIINHETAQCQINQAVTEYETISLQKMTRVTCNTKELQAATVTLENKTYLFYLEYDGDFVSWSAPDNFICQANWSEDTVNHYVATEGIEDVYGNGNAVLICHNDDIVINMTGIPPLPSVIY